MTIPWKEDRVWSLSLISTFNSLPKQKEINPEGDEQNPDPLQYVLHNVQYTVKKLTQEETEKCDSQSREKKVSINQSKVQMLELAGENFKVVIVNIFKNLKENIVLMNAKKE